MFFVVPGWIIAIFAIGLAELDIFGRAVRPEVYKAARAAGKDEMGWFVWLIALLALPVTVIVYAVGSIVGAAKKSG